MFHVQISVHHGMPWSVVFKRQVTDGKADPMIHFQCVSGVHFKPFVNRMNDLSKSVVSEKYVITCTYDINRYDTQCNVQDYVVDNDTHDDINDSELFLSLIFQMYS